jgi:ribonuclease P/MRP protein subunit POP1
LVQRSTQSADKTDQSNTAIHGFTLFAPAGWGMPIWQSLVFTGSLIAGLKERRNQYLEAGRPSFPEDYPHTAAGKAYWASRAAKDELRWLRKPASKRLNFIRLQGNDPWKPNWKQVFAAQERRLYDDEEMEVNGDIPRQSDTWLLSAWITKADELSRITAATSPEQILIQILNEYRDALQLSPIRLVNVSSLYRHCLVRGVLTCDEGGSPKDMAYIFQYRENSESSVS